MRHPIGSLGVDDRSRRFQGDKRHLLVPWNQPRRRNAFFEESGTLWTRRHCRYPAGPQGQAVNLWLGNWLRASGILEGKDGEIGTGLP